MNDTNHTSTRLMTMALIQESNISTLPLSQKAVLAKLTTNKPRTAYRNEQGTQIVNEALGDDANVVSTKLFNDSRNPVRVLLSAVDAKYREHNRLTLPYQERGPRLLPMSLYDKYRTTMRDADAKIDRLKANVLPDYDLHVQADMERRTAAAIAAHKPSTVSLADYPSAQEFASALSSRIQLVPLPDVRHPLFDTSSEELSDIKNNMAATLAAAEEAITQRAHEDMMQRMTKPLAALVNKLRVPIGEAGHIFRDSAIENIIESCDLVQQIAKGIGADDIYNAAEEVRSAVTTRPIHQLRESPIVRAEVAQALAAVESKLGFFFNNN